MANRASTRGELQTRRNVMTQELALPMSDAELTDTDLDQVSGGLIQGLLARIAVRVAAKVIIYAGDKVYDWITD
jgi:hypothetical protein